MKTGITIRILVVLVWLTPQSLRVAVQFPDLSTLEPDVREQIKSQQEALVAIVKDPKSNETKLRAAYGELGETYHAYSLNAPARECYVNASRLIAKDFRWIYLLAKLDQIEGRVDDAIQRFRTVSSLRPKIVAAQVNLGNIYLELNRLEEAHSSFASALQKQANNPAAHYGLGRLFSKRNYVEAVEISKRLLRLHPKQIGSITRLEWPIGACEIPRRQSFTSPNRVRSVCE